MRLILNIFMSITIMLFSISAKADVPTLNAIQAAGVELTQAQQEAVKNALCRADDITEDDKVCANYVQVMANLISQLDGNDDAIEAVLRAINEVQPQQIGAVFAASESSIQESLGTFVVLRTELDPTAATAAGVAEPGATAANPPLAVGPGGISSPS